MFNSVVALEFCLFDRSLLKTLANVFIHPNVGTVFHHQLNQQLVLIFLP